MNIHLSRLTLLSLLLVISMNGQAEIYKWTDANGKTHYSQTPPADITHAKDIADEIGMAAGTASTAQTTTKPAVEAAATGDPLQQAKKKGEENTIKHQTFCKQQNSALQQLLANPVIRWKSKAEEKILTAKERQQKIAEFEKNIKEMCNADVLATKENVASQ